MVGVVNPLAGKPCAIYTNMNTSLTFASGTFGTYTGPISVAASSTPGQLWGEDPDGTYTSTNCTGTAGQPIPGFTLRIVGGTSLNCTVTNAKYVRGVSGGHFPELNIRYYSNGGSFSGSCAGETSVNIKTTIVHAHVPPPVEYVTACNSLIAPSACLLGPSEF